LAENLRQAVEKRNYGSSPNLSIGVSVVQAGDTDMNDAIRRADKNLYKRKQQGRNRVIGA
jgi:diguanylate cyclase